MYNAGADKSSLFMNLAIIGTGYVGLTTGTCFAEVGHNVLCVDNNAAKVEALTGGGQDWESGILGAGDMEDTETEEAEPEVVTMVKYDPLRIAAILGAGVLAAVVLVLVFVLASKKRKAV